jgi:hypothetical protein
MNVAARVNGSDGHLRSSALPGCIEMSVRAQIACSTGVSHGATSPISVQAKRWGRRPPAGGWSAHGVDGVRDIPDHERLRFVCADVCDTADLGPHLRGPMRWCWRRSPGTRWQARSGPHAVSQCGRHERLIAACRRGRKALRLRVHVQQLRPDQHELACRRGRWTEPVVAVRGNQGSRRDALPGLRITAVHTFLTPRPPAAPGSRWGGGPSTIHGADDFRTSSRRVAVAVRTGVSA